MLLQRNYPFVITNCVGSHIKFFFAFFSFPLNRRKKPRMIIMIILVFKNTPEIIYMIQLSKKKKGKQESCQSFVI